MRHINGWQVRRSQPVPLCCCHCGADAQDRGQPQPQPPESYFHVIKNDKEHVINIVVHLVEGLATASAPIQACVEHFEKR